MPADWEIPDDGIIDEIAIRIAAAGRRPVALSLPEMQIAAGLITARHGLNMPMIASRLRVSVSRASELAASPQARVAAIAARTAIPADYTGRARGSAKVA